MPIYAYKCSACGYAHDTLQKISDAPLTVCPECKQSTYSKQVTAAGFQLKGSGWYVTDFRDKGTGAAKTSEPAATPVAKDAAPVAGGSTATPAASASSPASGSAPAASASGASSAAAPASTGSSTASAGSSSNS